jgi:outer membrane protein assembly factor BamB
MKMKLIIVGLTIGLFMVSCGEPDWSDLLKDGNQGPQPDPTDVASVWSYRMGYYGIHITKGFIYGKNFVSLTDYNGKFIIQANNLETGDSVWRQTNVGKCTPFFANQCQSKANILVLSDATRTLALDMIDGEILWKDYTDNGEGEISIINNKVIKTASGTGWSSVYSMDLKTGQKEQIFRRTREENDGISPRYFSPVRWSNSNGEELLIFYSQSVKSSVDNRFEVFAYNLKTQQKEWLINLDDSYQPTSLTINDGKLYLHGIYAMHCLSLENGTLIWQSPIEFRSDDFKIVSNKIFVTSGEILSQFTGEKLSTKHSQNFGYFMEANNEYVFASRDKVNIINVSTHDLIRYGDNFGWYVVPHPTNNWIYLTKGNSIFCLDMNKMK